MQLSILLFPYPFKLDSTILENNQIAVSMTGADSAEVQQNMIKAHVDKDA